MTPKVDDDDAAAADGDEAECDDGGVFQGLCASLRCRLPAASIVSLSANGPPHDGQSFPAAPCTRRTAEEDEGKTKETNNLTSRSSNHSESRQSYKTKTADGGDMGLHKLHTADDKGTWGMCVFVRDTRIHSHHFNNLVDRNR